MAEEHKYLIVDAEVLPDIFLKVIKAKELLAKNIAKNSSNACEIVGLSRSTFYRYRNCVEIFDRNSSQTLTLYLSLNDEPGVLAKVLDTLRSGGANVLTINQNIPVNGVAPVCIAMRNTGVSEKIFIAIDKLKNLTGVIDVKLV